MNALADSLQMAFLESGLSKPELAKRTRLAIQYLTSIFKGTKEPDKWDIKRICKGIGVEPDDILDIDSKEVIFPKLKKASSGTRLKKEIVAISKPGDRKKSKKIKNRNIRLHDVTRLEDCPCLRCSILTLTERHAHYEGAKKYLYGKGTSQKVDDDMTAWLCDKCDAIMSKKPDRDDYIATIEHDNEWMHLIKQTEYLVRQVNELKAITVPLEIRSIEKMEVS